MTQNCIPLSELHLCHEKLAKENRDFNGTGGVSKENYSQGFTPAFFDTDTGKTYRSCHQDGTLAAIHLLEGLPEELIIARDQQQNIITVKSSVIPGFLKDNKFYTREQAAELATKTK